jgi:putative ABC transport system permease protein
MALPLKYNVANVLVRWRATLATVLGIALTVCVFVLVQSLAEGIKKSSAATGDPRNVLVVRKGSTAESSSLVSRAQLRTIQYFEEIARNERGEPLISADIIVLVSLPRRDGNSEANVLLRGITPRGMDLRPQVRLVPGRDARGDPAESRWFTPGKREVVVSERLARRFANLAIGQSFKAGPATFTVVGWLEGGGSAYDSECWLDADECRAIFDREMYSSFLIRPRDEAARTNLIARLQDDKRLQLRAEAETEYYRKQTMTAEPIKWLGTFLAVTMSVGAVFAAMNTMYAAVGARTREVGTLRVLGFRRRTVLVSFLIEGALLAFIGGMIGCALSLPMNGYTTATVSLETFSETVFAFTITPALLAKGLLFAVVVGVVGTLLPAVRASRLPVIAALKSL